MRPPNALEVIRHFAMKACWLVQTQRESSFRPVKHAPTLGISVPNWRNPAPSAPTAGLTPRLVLGICIPPPPNVDQSVARDLQRAAIRGFQYWSRKPFELIIDSRTTSSEPADITVSWNSGLSGSQLGVTRFRWSMEGGAPEFRVLGLVLATRSPADWRSKLKPQQVLLTAAHEMGHALGLPHSDSPRDVMYSTNTARSLSTRDFKTVDALYGLPNGAEITN